MGTRAATFLPAGAGMPPVVVLRAPAGHAGLVEWPRGEPRYIDRGGGGWQRGALIGADGIRLWQPEGDAGMDRLAAGDLDGDDRPEFVVGYNGGGVRLLDSAGRERWRKGDGNVRHVEIVDADGDGKPEIVHSNVSGLLTLRDASGNVLGRVRASGCVSQFSVVHGPSTRAGLLHAGDGRTEISDFDGRSRVHLETPDTSFLCETRGTAARIGGRDYLVFTASQANWDRTQLFVFDPGGVLMYQEVVPAECVAVAAPESGEE